MNRPLSVKPLAREILCDLDPVIAPAVVALRLAGVETTGSCQGHMEPAVAPYIHTQPPGLETIPPAELDAAWRKHVLALAGLIHRHYSRKQVGDPQALLSLTMNGTIQPAWAEFPGILACSDRRRFLRSAQQEFLGLAEFLAD